MGTEHQRYESLAVGHVLGGLTDDESDAFRSHLVACRDCRRRVAELRDIAAGLEAAEREERSRASLTRDAVAEEHDLSDPGGPAGPVPTWVLALAAAGLVVLLVALFWSYHLRRVVDEYAATVAAQDAVMDTLVRGESLAATGGQGVGVSAARLDDRVAVVLNPLPELPSEAVIVLWLLDGDEVVDRRPLTQALRVGERETLPFSFRIDGASEAVVSMERAGAGQPDEPGRVLAEVPLEPER